MRAFVTGGTGFLGQHVIEVLVERGWDVVALHRASSDVSALAALPHVELVIGDVTDFPSLQRAIPDRVDAVFHVAGSAGALPHAMEYTRYAINHEGTRNVVQVCLDKNIGRLIYTSTIATYDYKTPQPLTEQSPINLWSRDAYIHSKVLAELEVEKMGKQGLDFVCLHPCAILGRYDKDTWSKAFRELERGLPAPVSPPGGLNVSSARSIATAHVDAFYKGRCGGHYILGGPAVPFLVLFQAIARVLQRPGPKYALPPWAFKLFGWTEFLASTALNREPALTPHTIQLMCEVMYGDSSLAQAELGYQPSTLEDAIQDCYLWMVSTGRLIRHSIS